MITAGKYRVWKTGNTLYIVPKAQRKICSRVQHTYMSTQSLFGEMGFEVHSVLCRLSAV